MLKYNNETLDNQKNKSKGIVVIFAWSHNYLWKKQKMWLTSLHLTQLFHCTFFFYRAWTVLKKERISVFVHFRWCKLSRCTVREQMCCRDNKLFYYTRFHTL